MSFLRTQLLNNCYKFSTYAFKPSIRSAENINMYARQFILEPTVHKKKLVTSVLHYSHDDLENKKLIDKQDYDSLQYDILHDIVAITDPRSIYRCNTDVLVFENETEKVVEQVYLDKYGNIVYKVFKKDISANN